MVEVFFTVQTLKRGLPTSSVVTRFVDKGYGTRSEALQRIKNAFNESLVRMGDSDIKTHRETFNNILTELSFEECEEKGAAYLLSDKLVCVSLVEGNDAKP